MVCWVVSDEQPGIGADGFQEIFTATMMASLEWGCYDYARGVLDNWLTYFIKDKGFVLYRGLEMAQHGRMLTNIAQCTRPDCPFKPSIAVELARDLVLAADLSVVRLCFVFLLSWLELSR